MIRRYRRSIRFSFRRWSGRAGQIWARNDRGKGRVKVHAEFDGIPYDGSIVNMGVKDEEGNVCYLIGLLKAIRLQLGKGDGDSVHVVIRERK